MAQMIARRLAAVSISTKAPGNHAICICASHLADVVGVGFFAFRWLAERATWAWVHSPV